MLSHGFIRLKECKTHPARALGLTSMTYKLKIHEKLEVFPFQFMKASFQAGGGVGVGGGSKYSDYCLSAVEPTNTVCSLLVSQFRPDNRSG